MDRLDAEINPSLDTRRSVGVDIGGTFADCDAADPEPIGDLPADTAMIDPGRELVS